MPHPPHPANVPGDFYVEEGCCITCGVPMQEAPEIFGWAGEPDSTHCVVVHQPKTAQSVDRTLNAMLSSEVDCIRYRGADREIARRIVEMGGRNQCDRPPPADATPLTRSHATFNLLDVGSLGVASDLALHFLQHTFRGSDRYKGHVARRLFSNGKRAGVRVSWFKDVYHAVTFEKLADGRWHIVVKPSHRDACRGLSRLVEKWLGADERFQNVTWFSEKQWRSKKSGQATVV